MPEPLTIDAKDAIARIQNICTEYESDRAQLLLTALGIDHAGLDNAAVLARWNAIADANGEQYDQAWDNLDRSAEDTIEVSEGAIEALNRALDVLQILAHGGTPEQG